MLFNAKKCGSLDGIGVAAVTGLREKNLQKMMEDFDMGYHMPIILLSNRYYCPLCNYKDRSTEITPEDAICPTCGMNLIWNAHPGRGWEKEKKRKIIL